MLNMAQINFCAIECDHQRTSPLAVSGMCQALEYAENYSELMQTKPLGFIKTVAFYVEPNQNQGGFRVMPVHFGDPTRQAINAKQIEQALTSLFLYGDKLHAGAKYYEFQKIHPFNDGNGRVGAILYNIWLGDNYLRAPLIPPRMFN